MMIVIPERLSIAVLAFYFVCLGAVLFIVHRHIHHFTEGWYYLLLTVLLRVVGSAADIAAWTKLQHDHDVPDEALFTLSEVSRSIAAFLLLLNVLGIFHRLNDRVVRTLRARGLACPTLDRAFAVLAVIARGLTLPAIGLTIVGASKFGARPTEAEIDASYAFRKAGAVVLLAAYLFYVLLAIVLATRNREMGVPDRRLFLVVVAALPFFLVVVVYQILFAFDEHTTAFLPWTLKPYPEAFMSTSMEFIIVILLVIGGLRCPVWRPSMADLGFENAPPMFPGNGHAVFQMTTPPLRPNIIPDLEPVSPQTQEPVTPENQESRESQEIQEAGPV